MRKALKRKAGLARQEQALERSVASGLAAQERDRRIREEKLQAALESRKAADDKLHAAIARNIVLINERDMSNDA